MLRLRDEADREAWSQFATAYAPLVHGFLRRQGMQDADALDVTQDVLAAISADIGRFEHRAERPGSFRRWLFTIVHNRTIDYKRRETRQPRGSGETIAQQLLAEIACESDALEEEWNREYLLSLFRTAAMQVQGDFRETSWKAFWKTTVDGLKPQSVAEELGLSVAAVYMAKRRILKRIQEQIAFLEGERR